MLDFLQAFTPKYAHEARKNGKKKFTSLAFTNLTK